MEVFNIIKRLSLCKQVVSFTFVDFWLNILIKGQNTGIQIECSNWCLGLALQTGFLKDLSCPSWFFIVFIAFWSRRHDSLCKFSQRWASPSWCPELPCLVGHGGWSGSVGDACCPHALAGIFRLMTTVALTHGLHQYVLGKGCASLVESSPSSIYFPNFWGLPIDEVKYRNVHLLY